MSYFSDASLVFIPSAQKSGKAYSIKPTDGTGDLTFTRSNDTASRVASNGLIERVRTNLILQSNSFSDAAWVKLGVGTGTAPVLTANYTTDPFGGNNAWRLQCDLNGGTASGDRSWIYQTFAGSPSNGTLSIYVKLNSAGSVNLIFSDGAGDTQTVTSTTWVRLNIPSAAIGEFRLGLIGYNGTDTCDLSIAFSQVETGDIATDYIATTSAAVSVGPVANVPRLDYLGSSCGRLILEGQRTNLLTFSEQLDNAAWLNAGGTTTANTAVSPSGYQDADTLTGARYQSSFGSNTYTLSAFAKKVDGDGTFTLRLDVPANKTAVFNLNNGTIVSTDAGYTSTITAYGNGWYRCTFTSPASTTISNAVLVSANAGVSNTFVYGCQLEVGAYATSYVNTLNSAVTRGADAASKTGISSLIGQTEGTLFAEVEWTVKPESGSPVISLVSLNNTTNIQNCIILGIERSSGGTNRFYCLVQVSNVTTAALIGSNITNGIYKAALAYKENDFVLYVNGVQIATDTSGAVPTNSQVIVGGRFVGDSFQVSDPISQALVFPTRLSNADLAALTA